MLILLTVTFFKGSSKPIFTLPASTRAILHKGKMRYLKKKKKERKEDMKRTLVRWGTQFLSNIIMILLWYYRGLAQAVLVFCFYIKMLSKQWKLDPIITNYVTLLSSDFFVTTSTLTVPTSFDRVNKQEDNNDNDNQWIKTKTSTLTTWLMIASGGWELNSSNMAAFHNHLTFFSLK